MQASSQQPRWKQWFKVSRLIPSLTILGAGASTVSSVFGLVKLTIPETIIIALLALLAVDSLVERISLLERLENKIGSLASSQPLKRRASLPKPPDYARHASEICVLGVSAHYVISQFTSFYESKLRGGCNLRIILLDPSGPSLETWKLQSQSNLTPGHIEGTSDVLKSLSQTPGVKGKCEVRLSEALYPFSMFAIDLEKRSGSMVIEFYSYKVHIDDRLHIQLTDSANPDWFDYYKQQFERAWTDSTVWKA